VLSSQSWFRGRRRTLTGVIEHRGEAEPHSEHLGDPGEPFEPGAYVTPGFVALDCFLGGTQPLGQLALVVCQC
jgi:hypothetical protein